jgi:hypothetical protein
LWPSNLREGTALTIFGDKQALGVECIQQRLLMLRLRMFPPQANTGAFPGITTMKIEA